MSRRRRRRLQYEVELNLASMLDMAFQLLAFFILTFRPSPIEGQLLLHLPPATPVTNVQAPEKPSDAQEKGSSFLEKSLDLRLLADANGRLASARLGLATVFDGPAAPPNLAKLDERLRFLFEHGSYDQLLIRIAPSLQYEDFMKIIDVCSQQKLPSGQPLRAINFAELPETEGGP